jgi:hypothetical protein
MEAKAWRPSGSNNNVHCNMADFGSNKGTTIQIIEAIDGGLSSRRRNCP